MGYQALRAKLHWVREWLLAYAACRVANHPGLPRIEKFPITQDFQLENWGIPGQTMTAGHLRNGPDWEGLIYPWMVGQGSY